MRKDLMAAVGAVVLVAGFALLLSDVTWLLYGRKGPFDLHTVQEEWTSPEGAPHQASAEVLTFRERAILTIRAHDGDMTPALRAAPIPDSLNRVARTMAEGGPRPHFIVRDIPGPDLELLRREGATGPLAFLVRITDEDAAMERSRGDTQVTAASVADSWRAALEDAFTVVTDSVAADSVAAAGAPGGADPVGG